MSGMTMLDYVHECPVRLKANLGREHELCDGLVSRYRTARSEGRGRVRLIACGSSYHACRAMQPLMAKLLDTDVDVVTPGAFVRYGADMPAAFEVMVSQSGSSTNIIAALDYARERGRETIVLTGNTESDVREHAGCVIDYGVGVETVGFVTVGLVTLMEYLALFALGCAHEDGRLSRADHERWLGAIAEAAQLHGELAQKTQQAFDAHEKLFLSPGPTFVLGDGPNYATALEGALKIQETLKVPATVYEPEEFIHGPNMQLTPEYTVFVIDTDPEPGRAFDIWRAVCEVLDRAFLVSTRAVAETAGVTGAANERILAVDGHGVDELLTPLCLVAPFQYLCARAMAALDCEDEHPLMKRFESVVSSKTEAYRTTHQ